MKKEGREGWSLHLQHAEELGDGEVDEAQPVCVPGQGSREALAHVLGAEAQLVRPRRQRLQPGLQLGEGQDGGGQHRDEDVHIHQAGPLGILQPARVQAAEDLAQQLERDAQRLDLVAGPPQGSGLARRLGVQPVDVDLGLARGGDQAHEGILHRERD
ncbi:hypothetical protein UVI_02014710 [Ustilaginoidea virens]|uniref:Uncharacterized protein n=1 Tax=Ustilaginoidea virens TaxID=1159556 RepID=A0A1B5L6F6_USTVR|nr:hypothetical protein UVI_02014710 [Ustilaginoidea virens]